MGENFVWGLGVGALSTVIFLGAVATMVRPDLGLSSEVVKAGIGQRDGIVYTVRPAKIEEPTQ